MSAATLTDTNNPNSQGALNDLICDFSVSVSDNIPASAGYLNNAPTDVMQSGWGIAVSGVMIFNGIGGSGVDAFYPAVFVNDKTVVTDAASNLETADYCLAHPSPNGDYHYHTASMCALDSSMFQFGAEYGGDFRTYMETEWMKVPYQSAFAVSKDGRPIYTPYHSGGQKRENCDVDVCNGFDD
jgi:hypothetical protein